MTWTEPKDCFFQTEDDVRSSEFFLRVGTICTMGNHMANTQEINLQKKSEKHRRANIANAFAAKSLSASLLTE